MLTTAIILFVIGAVFGLIILTAVLKNKQTPKVAVFIHGPIVAVGLVLVLVYVIQHASPLASLIFFLIAAVGGFVLFALDMQKKPLPKALAVLHPIIAAIGLVLLIIFVVSL